MRAKLVLVMAAACGAPAPGSGTTTSAPLTPSPPPPTLADSAMQPLAFMAGAWRTEDGTIEIWTPAGDALFGVTFAGGGFECVILAADDGVPTYTAMPGGQKSVPFRLDGAVTGDDARFTNAAHDHPQLIHYVRLGETMDATVSMLDGSDALRFHFTRVDLPAAPVLADADRQFAADTATGGATAWTSWFDAEGAMIRPAGRVEGRAAVEAAMTPLFSDPERRLEWEPVASGFAPTDGLGFTVGSSRLMESGKQTWRGAYVTIWRKQADGTWRVLFDTGDDA